MSQDLDQSGSRREPCINCGALIAREHPVHLRTVMELGKLPIDRRVGRIVELEGMSQESAQEFVDHKMGQRCVKTEPPCPSCGSALKTWHASICSQCNWQRDKCMSLLEY